MLLLPCGPIVASLPTTTPLLDLWLLAAEEAGTGPDHLPGALAG
jgi:hypothetical protein